MLELAQTSYDILNNISSFMSTARKAFLKNHSWSSLSIALNVSI